MWSTAATIWPDPDCRISLMAAASSATGLGTRLSFHHGHNVQAKFVSKIGKGFVKGYYILVGQLLYVSHLFSQHFKLLEVTVRIPPCRAVPDINFGQLVSDVCTCFMARVTLTQGERSHARVHPFSGLYLAGVYRSSNRVAARSPGPESSPSGPFITSISAWRNPGVTGRKVVVIGDNRLGTDNVDTSLPEHQGIFRTIM